MKVKRDTILQKFKNSKNRLRKQANQNRKR